MLNGNSPDSFPNDYCIYELSALSQDVYNYSDRPHLPGGWERKLWKEYPTGLAAGFYVKKGLGDTKPTCAIAFRGDCLYSY